MLRLEEYLWDAVRDRLYGAMIAGAFPDEMLAVFSAVGFRLRKEFLDEEQYELCEQVGWEYFQINYGQVAVV